MNSSAERTKQDYSPTERRVLSEIGRKGANALNNSRTKKQRSAAAKHASRFGAAKLKKCKHPDKRVVSCGYCMRTVARVVDGEVVEVRGEPRRKPTAGMSASAIARLRCKHPTERLRIACGFCRRPLENESVSQLTKVN